MALQQTHQHPECRETQLKWVLKLLWTVNSSRLNRSCGRLGQLIYSLNHKTNSSQLRSDWRIRNQVLKSEFTQLESEVSSNRTLDEEKCLDSPFPVHDLAPRQSTHTECAFTIVWKREQSHSVGNNDFFNCSIDSWVWWETNINRHIYC